VIGAPLRDELAAVGVEVSDARPVGGGDINDAYALTLADGSRAFLKTHASPPPGMYEAEARGLRWLDTGALQVPCVRAVGERFLVLQMLDGGKRDRYFDEDLGRGLAELHRATPESFGLDHDNFIGRLPQRNATRDTWVDFYREQRLEPMVAAAAELLSGMRGDLERLYAKLPELCGPEEPPARLHGDLWGGNLHVHGELPALIDPAAYGGHREMDLAMMRLFGGFGERVFSAYAEAHPQAPGYEERVPLYQLYPLLVHVNLFGGGYVGSVRRVLDRYV